MPLLLLSLFAFALSLTLTFAAKRALTTSGIMDQPNGRSMHQTPVPRGGGLAVLAVIVFGMMLEISHGPLWPAAALPLATLLLMIISWYDDRTGVGAAPRLCLHLVAAGVGSLALPQAPVLLPEFLPFWADRAILILGWAWFINLTNFMDGIDGLTGIETIAIAAGVGLMFFLTGFVSPFPPVLVALMIGATAGFLVFNWHPAKIFLGDVGSVPLGFLSGFLLLQLAAQGYRAAALILPLYYIADSGITLVKRLLRREKVWQAHREHYYQRAAQKIGRHDLIALYVLAADIALIAIATASIREPFIALGLGVMAVALLMRTMHKLASS